MLVALLLKLPQVLTMLLLATTIGLPSLGLLEVVLLLLLLLLELGSSFVLVLELLLSEIFIVVIRKMLFSFDLFVVDVVATAVVCSFDSADGCCWHVWPLVLVLAASLKLKE